MRKSEVFEWIYLQGLSSSHFMEFLIEYPPKVSLTTRVAALAMP